MMFCCWHNAKMRNEYTSVKGSIQKEGIEEHKGRLPEHPTFLFVNPLLLNLAVGQNKLVWVKKFE